MLTRTKEVEPHGGAGVLSIHLGLYLAARRRTGDRSEIWSSEWARGWVDVMNRICIMIQTIPLANQPDFDASCQVGRLQSIVV